MPKDNWKSQPRVPAGNSNGGQWGSSASATLSKQEWRLYYKKLSALKVKRGAEYMNSGGIPTIRIDDKLIISSGTFENPKVDVIIPIIGKDKWHK